MKKRLYILAPNDRFNYGDLLFPYILTYYFSNMFDDIVYVSTTKSDLSDRGGIKTKGYSELFNVDANWENHLIVAGGESLCTSWIVILSYIIPWVRLLYRLSYKMAKLSIGKRISSFCSSFVDFAFKTKTHFVFSVGKNELPQFKSIAYNALGGSGLLNSDILDNSKVRNILNSVDYFTVRDKVTSLALKKYRIKHAICPDTAIMMSDVFNEEMLLHNISISSELSKTDYIFFQGNLNLWKGKYELAASQLMDLANVTRYKICLCPIGTALGHSDQVALKNIASLLKCDYSLIERPNIFDIMWLIKHSKMYIGSSLHGVITAMSFSVPYIGYGPKKLKAYIEQWEGIEEEHFTEQHNLVTMAKKAFNVIPSSEKQKNIVKQSFNNLKLLYEQTHSIDEIIKKSNNVVL